MANIVHFEPEYLEFNIDLEEEAFLAIATRNGMLNDEFRFTAINYHNYLFRYHATFCNKIIYIGLPEEDIEPAIVIIKDD